MSRYYLSEAYASIYNPRLQEDFDDNLRFIDYMLDEDIEEVVESLFWEFRDYGNSIDESIELLRFSASSEIINESLEMLSESRAGERRMQQRAEVRAKQKSEREATTRGVDAKIRQDQRKARIDGAISRVKAAWKGATGGMGRAAKAISSGVSKAGEFVSQQRQAAKAKLQKLMRTGSQKVQAGVGRVQRAGAAAARELSGAPAREARLKYEFNKNVRAARTRLGTEKAFSEPKKTPSKPSDPWEGSATKPSSRATATTTSSRVLSGSSSRAALPPARSQSSTNPRMAAAQARAAKAAKGTTARGRRMAPPSGSGVGAASKRSNTGYREAAKRFAKQAGLEEHQVYELLDVVIEDLIYEGYAHDEYDALNIINNLNEDTLYDITQEYLAE